ncbi:hypothetical protein KGM_211945 [Danaus plexippus plexippus]|uniref:Uncharacterized protein n=1 Tax=Danaus plexippus plexippus TaxID=278856 RepID=A0A212FHZ3_DANPL|nr:hypothetical protein KGM_211945 [Danaus plexippus plexippus]
MAAGGRRAKMCRAVHLLSTQSALGPRWVDGAPEMHIEIQIKKQVNERHESGRQEEPALLERVRGEGTGRRANCIINISCSERHLRPAVQQGDRASLALAVWKPVRGRRSRGVEAGSSPPYRCSGNDPNTISLMGTLRPGSFDLRKPENEHSIQKRFREATLVAPAARLRRGVPDNLTYMLHKISLRSFNAQSLPT